MDGPISNRRRVPGVRLARFSGLAQVWPLDVCGGGVRSSWLRRAFERDDRRVLPVFEEGLVQGQRRSGSAAGPAVRSVPAVVIPLQRASVTQEGLSFRYVDLIGTSSK